MDKPIGLYVHIPFCASKCPYCNFYTIPFSSKLADELVLSIIADMDSYKNRGISANTLYFGGGTPSLIAPSLIQNIIKKSTEVFDLKGEITIECNPNSISYDKLNKYFNYGVNRISFGMQSIIDKELISLGRKHNIKQIIQCVENAKKVGFSNISLDVMIGTPYQDISSLNESINFIKQIDVEHISAYLLKIEENTPFFNSNIITKCASDEVSSDMYLQLVKSLKDIGLIQYEISNFCRAGFESKHNLKYWSQDEYLGFGPSAHSFFSNQRYCYKDNVTEYINNSYSPNKIILDSDINPLEEYIMLSIRTTNGISMDILRSKYSVCDSKINILEKELKLLIKEKFVIYNNIKLSLTPKGFLLSNTIIIKLLDILLK